MADSDTDSKRDEMERDNLQKSISEVETALTVSTPGTRALLENFIQNARGRVAVLDKRIKESEEVKAEHAREAAAVAMADLARKETALNEREREAYSGFLSKEFFTKNDFASLEKFYDKTWDRLSDGGKDQMSQRFWEGIRRNEYQFHEAPSAVREKETEWAYTTLSKSERSRIHTADIPEKDRGDFIRAYESGRRDEAEKILDRDSFKENMFRGSASRSIKQTRAEKGRESEGEKAGNQIAANENSAKYPTATERKSASDLSGIDLNGIKLAETLERVSSSAIPTAKAQATSQQSLS